MDLAKTVFEIAVSDGHGKISQYCSRMYRSLVTQHDPAQPAGGRTGT
ncbi:hypothetical protein [Arhodomonas sp. AD133]